MKSIILVSIFFLLSQVTQAITAVHPTLNFVSRLIYEQMPEDSIEFKFETSDRITTEKNHDGVTCSAVIEKNLSVHNINIYSCEFSYAQISYDSLSIQGSAAQLLMDKLNKLVLKEKSFSINVTDPLLGLVKVRGGTQPGATFLERPMRDDFDITCSEGRISPGVGELFESPAFKRLKSPNCNIYLGQMSYNEMYLRFEKNKKISK